LELVDLVHHQVLLVLLELIQFLDVQHQLVVDMVVGNGVLQKEMVLQEVLEVEQDIILGQLEEQEIHLL
jgi:hypothetical protein